MLQVTETPEEKKQRLRRQAIRRSLKRPRSDRTEKQRLRPDQVTGQWEEEIDWWDMN